MKTQRGRRRMMFVMKSVVKIREAGLVMKQYMSEGRKELVEEEEELSDISGREKDMKIKWRKYINYIYCIFFNPFQKQ